MSMFVLYLSLQKDFMKSALDLHWTDIGCEVAVPCLRWVVNIYLQGNRRPASKPLQP